MPVERMREIIEDQYPGIGWKTRVSRMGDAQVIAIYHTMLERGTLKKRSPRSFERAHQISMEEYVSEQCGVLQS